MSNMNGRTDRQTEHYFFPSQVFSFCMNLYTYRIYHVYEEYIAFILRVGVVYPAYTTFDQSVE